MTVSLYVGMLQAFELQHAELNESVQYMSATCFWSFCNFCIIQAELGVSNVLGMPAKCVSSFATCVVCISIWSTCRQWTQRAYATVCI